VDVYVVGDRQKPNPRLLILSDASTDQKRTAEDLERFGRFVRALAAKGLTAEHRFTPDEDSLRGILAGTVPDLVFSASLLCAPGPRGRVQVHALLEELGTPYVGSDPAVLELAIDKAALKERWQAAGVRTPAFIRVDGADDRGGIASRAAELGFPCIVKPDREGNSRGIGEDSVVRGMPALVSKVEETVRVFGSALVERFLGDAPDCREFTVAMIGSGDEMTAMPAEIVLVAPKAVRLVTNEDKDGHRTKALPIADTRLRAEVERFALAAFRAAGVRDYARCDLIMVGGELYAIEINGQPMVPDLWFEACAAGAGGDGFDEAGYLNAIVRSALQRPRGKGG